MTGNLFRGKAVTIAVDPSCEEWRIADNPGAAPKQTPIDFNHGRR